MNRIKKWKEQNKQDKIIIIIAITSIITITPIILTGEPDDIVKHANTSQLCKEYCNGTMKKYYQRAAFLYCKDNKTYEEHWDKKQMTRIYCGG